MASQAAGNGAASNKQPTPVAADHGRKWCNPRRLGAASSCVALSEHNSKALSPERVGFIQHTLHSVPRMAFKKPTPRPKLQRPPPTTKSSAKDSILRTVQLQYAGEQPNFNGTANAGLVRFWAKGLFVSDWCRRKSPRSGMDSDLEAFSHNPADGSFAAMPGQTAAKTNYLKPRFLSY
ncbi:hypothetical protein PtrM4_152900 [Pyrenophora tritici-repentis]|uniref:Uncharacterized protein n=1 Tax=Pyrenophora tritici-repentis TaxID=45151 RepID=A0A834VIH9_9PLEO|nr:hypothetical protein PtrM4_152900 [Pyrenophora tritici-repentis]